VVDSKGNVWVDAVKKFSDQWNVDMTQINKPILFGADRDPSSINDFAKNAYLDQVRIFNRTLTDEEVQILYNEMEEC
jgi:hypothetical protein